MKQAAVVGESDPARLAQQIPTHKAECDRRDHRQHEEQQQWDETGREEERHGQPKAPDALSDHQSATARSRGWRNEGSDGFSSTPGTSVGRSTSVAAPTAHFASSHGSTSTATWLRGGKTFAAYADSNAPPRYGHDRVPSPLTTTSSGPSTLKRPATARPRRVPATS